MSTQILPSSAFRTAGSSCAELTQTGLSWMPLNAARQGRGALAAASLKLLRGLARLPGMVARHYRHRRDLGTLAALNDHQLRDIGLNRADLVGAINVSLGEDPFAVLNAARRRHSRGDGDLNSGSDGAAARIRLLRGIEGA